MAVLVEVIRTRLRQLGVDVVRYPVHSTLEGHLRALLSAHRITVLFDVGANAGQFALRARREVRFGGRIESFEPTPEMFRTVTDQASGDDLWRTHRYALGSENGEQVLHMFDSSEWNSLHLPDESHLRAAGRSLTNVGSAPVPVRRLDGVWDELVRPGDVVMVKSDTQGHELEVLAGAGARLDSVEAVLLEASVTTFYEGEPTLTVMLERLDAMGFTPSGFFPVTRRQGSLGLDTVDVCFVRSGDHGPARY
jgi:FkbM family methyltransferase